MTPRHPVERHKVPDFRDAAGHEHPAGTGVPRARDHSLPSYWITLSGCKYSVLLLLLAMMMPTYTSFELGSFRLTAYRLLLIATILPNAFRLFSGRYNLLPADGLLVLGTLWALVTLVYHHGAQDGLEAGGILVVESLGAYLLARTAIRGESDYRSFVALTVALIIVVLPFTIFESLTNKNLFGQPRLPMEMRLGLHRARGPFEHPIGFGIFVASGLGMSWFCFPKGENPIGIPRFFRAGGILLATITSVSSGALTAFLVQLVLVVWNYLTFSIHRRWSVFSGLLILLYIVINLLSNRTPMKVFLTYLTFSPHTAYNRLTIWEWGFYKNVLENPTMGIGLNEWVRPTWMHSTSMDNFWLVLMVRHGFPCFLPIAAAGLYLLFAGAKRAGAAGVVTLQKGWTISMVGLIVAATTVHIWNALFVYFFFILGAGAWFCNPQMERRG